MSDLPVIAVTMGDPSGIGPEVIVKALSDPAVYELCRPMVLGVPGAFSTRTRGLGSFLLREISTPSEARGIPGRVDLLAVKALQKDRIMPGKPTVEGGMMMVQCIIEAVHLAKLGHIAAMVTCPISKLLMQQAGYFYEGHTQLIASLTECQDYVMMLAGQRLRVALVTIHCSLKEVPLLLNLEDIYKTIRITSRALKEDFGVTRPRIAVAALNPHGGEEGLFGAEEEEIIRPAVEKARGEGYLVEGPYPADSIFHKAAGGRFDAVVSMYHDQGLIPIKLLHFSDAVNVTLGLPIIRTSVDHGTAYDIAGKGIADPSSLKAAIAMAAVMAKNRASGPGVKAKESLNAE